MPRSSDHHVQHRVFLFREERLMKFLLASALIFSAQTSFADTIEEIIVTATLRDTELTELPMSVTVLTEKDIQTREAQHFDQLLNMTPNVNFSAGASRGRFVQIRGIGERSQFKDPLDSSIGLVIDGVDFSGIGLAGALFDVRQIEILRGPQGTAFGSNAMGGLMLLETNNPSDVFQGNVLLGAGNYSSYEGGAVISGPITDALSGRLAIHQFVSNGFIENSFLDRDNTNDFDEHTLRGKLRWQAGDATRIDVFASYYDTNNGYDAFSLENSRRTRSDEPGHDRQQSNSFSIAVSHEADLFVFDGRLFLESSDLGYGFDWDWSNVPRSGIRGGENNKRQRDSIGFDIRISSKGDARIADRTGWIVGLYRYERDVELFYDDHWEDSWGFYPSSFNSDFSTQRLAAYGQFDRPLSEQLHLTIGARWETYDDAYHDSAGVTAAPEDDLWGGRISLEYLLNDLMLYGTLSRGYKTGGINGQASAGADAEANPEIAGFLEQRLSFRSETLISYEVGLRRSHGELTWSLSLFHMKRDDMQAKAWILFPPAEWKSYLDNVENGSNQGIEFSFSFRASDRLTLDAGLGLLKAKLGDLTVQDIDSFPPTPVDQSSRDQAHAPDHQFFIAANYLITPSFSLNIQVEGKDCFFFSNGHDIKSDSFSLTHATLRYQFEQYNLALWARNLFNEDYKVRGFYFANNPLNGWINEPYFQFGEPRTFGLTARVNF